MGDKGDKVNDRRADEALELLQAVVFALKARMHRALSDGETGLAGMEGRCLGYFARHPGSTQGDLVRHSGRDKGQIARVVHHLREEGLLEQVEDPSDRRNVRLRVTPAGERLHREVHRLRKAAGSHAFAGLEAAELEGFVTVLERMRANLE